MNRIKSTRQIQAEKERLKQKRQELEYKLQNNWLELKECLRPANIAKDAIGSILKKKTEKNLDDSNIVKSSFTYGISLLARKFADKTEERLGKLLQPKKNIRKENHKILNQL